MSLSSNLGYLPHLKTCLPYPSHVLYPSPSFTQCINGNISLDVSIHSMWRGRVAVAWMSSRELQHTFPDAHMSVFLSPRRHLILKPIYQICQSFVLNVLILLAIKLYKSYGLCNKAQLLHKPLEPLVALQDWLDQKELKKITSKLLLPLMTNVLGNS